MGGLLNGEESVGPSVGFSTSVPERSFDLTTQATWDHNIQHRHTNTRPALSISCPPRILVGTVALRLHWDLGLQAQREEASRETGTPHPEAEEEGPV